VLYGTFNIIQATSLRTSDYVIPINFAKRVIFFQNLTLGYMTKTLNHIIFFFLHQNQNIFFSNIGNQNIFLEKNHNPPLQVKWSFPNSWFICVNKILRKYDLKEAYNYLDNPIKKSRWISLVKSTSSICASK
jgi:hypothetical protein